MDEREPLAGPQFNASRPVEQEAVRTTIVGGRPPGSGQPSTNVCRGWEVLLKKASVDPEFKRLLIDAGPPRPRRSAFSWSRRKWPCSRPPRPSSSKR